MVQRHDFNDKQSLAVALAKTIANQLATGIAERGSASLAVSGGSTPKKLFAALSTHQDIDWSKVTITLVDERWVDANSDRSNARLVNENLICNAAANAQFVPLYSGGKMPDESAIAKVNQALNKLPMPFDAVILGMGNDGHTASFFPGGDTLELALTDPGPALALNAQGAGEPRVTLTLPFLLQARCLIIHIEGEEKSSTLDKVVADGEIAQMPVRAVLRQQTTPVQIYWCP